MTLNPAQSTGTGGANAPSGVNSLEQQVRARIESMSYLPTTVAVAMKFVELGKDPDADPGEYVKVISSDSSLSTKLLSLANSSWFGVRNRVTRVQVAVNLLGLGTVRTLAISYCITGLHNELRLTAEESRMFWAASLCKAVAAKRYATLRDPKQAEEAFAAGLFQDFAMPVMFAAAKQEVLALVHDTSLDSRARLGKERELFRLDHAELARCVAQKLELPEIFVDAVAFHHNVASLSEFVNKPVIAEAVYVASLFPHVLDGWNRADAEEMKRYLAEHGGANLKSPEAFLEEVQKEFNQLYCYFEQGDPPDTKLVALLEAATKEVADCTTRLVGTVHELLQQAASAGKEVHQLMKNHNALEEAATHDALTGALNREGFTRRATEMVAAAQRYNSTFAVAFLDVDRFKELNDTAGHAQGDAALQSVVDAMKQNLRQADLVGRLGGDEFALLLADCSEESARQAAERILAAVASQGRGVTLSAGLIWIQPRGHQVPLDKIIQAADALMYEAKRAGGNRLQSRAVGVPQRGAA